MLKTRIITALILGALVISAVFHPSHIFFSLLVSAFVLFGAWEWSVLAGLKLPFLRLIYAMSVLLATLGLTSLEGLFPITLLLLPVNIFWVFTFLWLIFGPSPEVQKITIFQGTIRLFLGYLLLASAALGLLTLKQESAGLLMYVLGIAWVADIGAFFTGRQWGHVKLAPTLSPGKSWEGAVGGIVLVGLYALSTVALFELADTQVIVAFVIATFTSAVFSIIGDLYESYIKRKANKKDSGTLLPGHGGVLDRIDSMLASVPVFVFVFYLIK